jgi:hypothetical protein
MHGETTTEEFMKLKFIEIFMGRTETEEADIKSDAFPTIIDPKARKEVERVFVDATPENPQIGVCNTCAPGQIKFLSELRDIEDGRSCFMLGHDVEPLAGLPAHMTLTGKAQARKAMEEMEYDAWLRGQMDL